MTSSHAATRRSRPPRTCSTAGLRTSALVVSRVIVLPAPRTSRARTAACRTGRTVLRSMLRHHPDAKTTRRGVLVSRWRCIGLGSRLTCRRGSKQVTALWRKPPARPNQGSIDSGGAGGRWYSNTVRYVIQTGNYAADIERAVQAWNNSGVNIRWVEVPASQAEITFYEDKDVGDALGTGTAPGPGGLLRSGRVRMRPGLLADYGESFTPEKTHQVIADLAAHEMGHVMGLGHEAKVCATMDANLWEFCTLPGEQWNYPCRILQPIDIQRAAAIYGGKPRDPGPDVCTIGAGPGTVTNLTATPLNDGSANYHVSWRLPDNAQVTGAAITYRPDHTCPTSPNDSDTYQPTRIDGNTPRDQSTDFAFDYPGRVCLAVFALGTFMFNGQPIDRWDPPATIQIDVPEQT